jgi:predicted RNA-binding Zn ribbon-like protein
MSRARETFATNGFGKTYAWIDLVNSEEFDGSGVVTDHLSDPKWVRAFLARWVPGSVRKADRRDLRLMRGFLRRLAGRIASGRRLAKSDLKAINEAMLVPTYRVLRGPRNLSYTLDVVPSRKDWRWVRAEIFRSVACMLAEGNQRRLKICANPGCKWVLIDRTHANSRRWCSQLTCGNRDKVRRFRERRSAGHG